MPNDAKLGMLVGVMGVIAAAVLTPIRTPVIPVTVSVPQAVSPREAPKVCPAPAPRMVERRLPKPDTDTDPLAEMVELQEKPAPTILPSELPSTPVVRTKREPAATTAGRPRDADLEP